MQKITYVHLIGDSKTKLWGLTGRERLQRMVKACKHTILIEDATKLPQQSTALLLCADHLFDTRILTALIGMKENMALYNDEGEPVAVHIIGRRADGMLAGLLPEGNRRIIATLPHYNVADMQSGFQQNLKKKDAAYVLPMTKTNQKELESELFDGSYKGVTDLITKWLWPVPAFWFTKLCVRNSWSPNHVTIASWILAILAGVAFWFGHYGTGLIMGWAMTFLDTVDGKLARVTVTSSRLGDVLDHGLDLIHPPLWYIAWGVGLASTLTPIADITLALIIGLILLGYIGGRLCEGAFQLWLAPFDMFIWRQFDSFNRLITARRNPNMILLTFSWFIDRPDIGLFLVVIWHLVSTVILSGRLYSAWLTWKHQGKLVSWLADIDTRRDREMLAVRIFTRAPMKNYGKPSKH